MSEVRTQMSQADLISRSDAIKAVNEYLRLAAMSKTVGNMTGIQEILEKLPSADTDLSDYSDKLWRAAYERGKKEAMESIVRCGECRHFDEDNGVCKVDGNGGWQADDFCSTGQRREE